MSPAVATPTKYRSPGSVVQMPLPVELRPHHLGTSGVTAETADHLILVGAADEGHGVRHLHPGPFQALKNHSEIVHAP